MKTHKYDGRPSQRLAGKSKRPDTTSASSVQPQRPASLAVPARSVGLPPPSAILPSNAATRCFACSRKECRLSTHKQYTRMAIATHQRPFDPTTWKPWPHARGFVLSQSFHEISSQIENPRIDPFARYPIPMNDETHHLLDLWTRPWSLVYRGPQRHLFPKPIINLVLPSAINHAALFQGLLSVSATQWSLAYGNIDEVALRHQQEAVRLHADASRDEESACTDANVLAALTIVFNEITQGKLVESEQHMVGINHLVRLRGGPQYLGMDGVVASSLMYADHVQAVFHDQQPIWEMPLPSLKFCFSFTPNLGRGFRTITGGQELDADLLSAIHDICQLTELLTLGIRGKVPARELNAIGYLSTVVEYQLAHLNAMYHQTATRSECVCLALLLFNSTVLRNVGAIGPEIRKTEYHFWTTFQAAAARGCWAITNTKLLAWVLFTGLTTMVRADCPWLPLAVDELRKALADNPDLRDWDDVKRNILEPFLWSDLAQDEVLRPVWEQVGPSRAESSPNAGVPTSAMFAMRVA